MIGAEHAQAAHQHGHFRRAQPQQLRAVDQQLLGGHAVRDLQIVAEAVRLGLEHRETVRVGLLLRGVRPAGGEGTSTSRPASFAAFSIAAEPPSTMRSASETFLPRSARRRSRP